MSLADRHLSHRVAAEYGTGGRFGWQSAQGKFVNFELLIFGGMGIIKGPLLKGDISTDKINQPAVLLVKILNN